MGVQSSLRAVEAVLDPTLSYWRVVLTTGKTLTEHKLVFDFRRGGYRQIDWALDLNSTNDVMKIKELSLVCPNGEMRTMQITVPGTAIQFKHGHVNTLGLHSVEAQGIGVVDKATGNCNCWIWDKVNGLIEYKSNVDTFGTWREGLIPLTKLSRDVIGLRL